MSEEQLNFQAEVSRLLDIVANSLYSHKEVFLRELISNASDACDRLRHQALTAPDLVRDDPGYRIQIIPNKAKGTLTVADNGIGMSRDELVENLGTIARSGTAAFVEQLGRKPDDISLIGQFGVGFYSAFMVADRVEVVTRKAGDEPAWRWASDGKGRFTIAEAEAESAPTRGTAIILHLRKDQKEYLDPERLRRLVATYSDHIAVPIELVVANGKAGNGAAEATQINRGGALWTRPKSEITEEQYTEFYHHVGQTFDEPWLRMHFKAEGVIEYTGLLFVPSTKPWNLFDPDRKHRVRLYCKRVFITDDCEDLIPAYLRFLHGVIDTEDLPLNVSRELLQKNPVVAKIRAAVTKRVLGELEKRADKEPEGYAAFWNNFGAVLKEGLYEDQAQRESLLRLARFRSTEAEGLVSLADYVARMKPGQKTIFYLSGDQPDKLLESPQLEGFAAKGVEVLLLSDPVDEFWISAVGQYGETPFKSVTRGAAELDAIAAAATADEPSAEDGKAEPPAGLDALIAFVKLALKDEVKDVRVSQRLTSSAVCLIADDGDMDMHLERLLKAHRQIEGGASRILEINPNHPLIRRMAEQVGQEGAGSRLEDMARLLLDQARIVEGESLPDPAGFARRINQAIERALACAE